MPYTCIKNFHSEFTHGSIDFYYVCLVPQISVEPVLHHQQCCGVLQVRIMFEVQDLKYATLATVSRCGMVWFSEDVLSTEMIFENYLMHLRHVPVEEGEEEVRFSRPSEAKEDILSPSMQVSCVKF